MADSARVSCRRYILDAKEMEKLVAPAVAKEAKEKEKREAELVATTATSREEEPTKPVTMTGGEEAEAGKEPKVYAKEKKLQLRFDGCGLRDFAITVGGVTLQSRVELLTAERGEESVFELVAESGGRRRRAKAVVAQDASQLSLFCAEGTRWDFGRTEAAWRKAVSTSLGAADEAGSHAPMPGVVEKLMVAAGEAVTAGQPLVVMVAMKMEYVIRSPRAGVVESLSCEEGESVAKGQVLVKLVEEEEEVAARA